MKKIYFKKSYFLNSWNQLKRPYYIVPIKDNPEVIKQKLKPKFSI